MISQSVALEGTYTLRLRDGSERRVAAENGQVTTVDMAPVIEAHNRFSRELANAQLTRSS
jgi:hypothetical protein